jgi:hypothetical protein
MAVCVPEDVVQTLIFGRGCAYLCKNVVKLYYFRTLCSSLSFHDQNQH